MREFKNNTARDISFEEHEAILQCAKILSKAFKRKIFSASINPHTTNASDVWGIAFSFDMYVEYKEG